MKNSNTEPWFMDGSTSGAVTGKDLGAVQDEMYQEALAYKKCSVYASRFRDPALQKMAQSPAEHHRQHFDALRDFLQTRQ